MTGDRVGQKGTFERQRETYFSLPRISFNIKDMVEEKAS
jgi:predicted ester cyclase